MSQATDTVETLQDDVTGYILLKLGSCIARSTILKSVVPEANENKQNINQSI